MAGTSCSANVMVTLIRDGNNYNMTVKTASIFVTLTGEQQGQIAEDLTINERFRKSQKTVVDDPIRNAMVAFINEVKGWIVIKLLNYISKRDREILSFIHQVPTTQLDILQVPFSAIPYPFLKFFNQAVVFLSYDQITTGQTFLDFPLRRVVFAFQSIN